MASPTGMPTPIPIFSDFAMPLCADGDVDGGGGGALLLPPTAEDVVPLCDDVDVLPPIAEDLVPPFAVAD